MRPVILLTLFAAGCGPGVATYRQVSAVVPAGLPDRDESAQSVQDCPDPSTAGLSGCAHQRYLEAAQRMKATFDELMARVTRQYVEILERSTADARAEGMRLQAAQTAWEQFRDLNCQTTLETGFDPEGTTYSVGQWECMTRMTQQRTDELQEHIRQMPLPGESS